LGKGIEWFEMFEWFEEFEMFEWFEAPGAWKRAVCNAGHYGV